MSDCRHRYINKHGAMMDGMKKGSTCRRTGSPMDGRTNDACDMDECNEHAPSRTNEPVKPPNMQARNNMQKLHQAN